MLPELKFVEGRQRFLPVPRAVLRAQMLRDPRLSDTERRQLAQFCELVAASFHVEFRARLERLQVLYDAFDPDRDTLPLDPPQTGATAPEEEFSRTFAQLLHDANYVEMTRDEVKAWAGYQSRTGLVVEANLSEYAELRVFYRGLRYDERRYRARFAPWRWKTEQVHVLPRVAVLVRLANEPQGPIYLKVFKSVVAEDLEMVLPFVRIRMRLLDHMKISSSVAGGVVTASWKAFATAVVSRWMFLLLMFSFMGAAIRGVFSFLSSKTRYMHALAANLYFRSLANNSSVLTYLLDSAEAEECKETLLGYYLLLVERGQALTPAELDQRVEDWLQTEFNLEVDFEISDTVRKLVDKGLLIRQSLSGPAMTSSAGALQALDLPDALARLDETWDNLYTPRG
jgi:hypothetical protein